MKPTLMYSAAVEISSASLRLPYIQTGGSLLGAARGLLHYRGDTMSVAETSVLQASWVSQARIAPKLIRDAVEIASAADCSAYSRVVTLLLGWGCVTYYSRALLHQVYVASLIIQRRDVIFIGLTSGTLAISRRQTPNQWIWQSSLRSCCVLAS